MSENLKPCPFDGSEAERCQNSEGPHREAMFWVLCRKCHACPGVFATQEKADAAWNTRAQQAGEPKPAAWVSPEQFAAHTDYPPPETLGGRYLPVRKTPAGNFTQPLFAHPPKADPDVVRLVEAAHALDARVVMFDLDAESRAAVMAVITAGRAIATFSALGEG